MPIVSDSFFRDRQVILSEMLSALVGAIPDAYTGEDGVLRIKFEIEASQLESLFLANQLVLEDMFIQSASFGALQMHGVERGLPMLQGLPSQGTLRFTGTAGTYIPLESEVVSNPGESAEVIYFIVTQEGTIPDLGVPTPPVAAIGAAGGLTGLYEYVVTFVDAGGETLPSTDSNAVSPSGQMVDLTNIPSGGVGTIGRAIYRQKNGTGLYRQITYLGDNTTTTYTDNNSDASVSVAGTPPAVDTSTSILLAAQAKQPGLKSNVAINTITELAKVPSGVQTVSNPTAFTGGTDQEDTDRYRERLLEWVRNPQSGSPADLKSWAESIPGVESATVFTNDNLGVATNGHATVRISTAGGAVPSTELITSVQAFLQDQDMANITIHVAGFTPLVTNITVDVALEGTYTLGDITASVQEAIQEYVNSLPVGATLYISGIVDAVFGLPGVADVIVTDPASNQTTPAASKRAAGVISVV